jgi:hypothetical protein
MQLSEREGTRHRRIRTRREVGLTVVELIDDLRNAVHQVENLVVSGPSETVTDAEPYQEEEKIRRKKSEKGGGV